MHRPGCENAMRSALPWGELIAIRTGEQTSEAVSRLYRGFAGRPYVTPTTGSSSMA